MVQKTKERRKKATRKVRRKKKATQKKQTQAIKPTRVPRDELLTNIQDDIQEAIWAVEAIPAASVSDVELYTWDAIHLLQTIKDKVEQLSNE